MFQFTSPKSVMSILWRKLETFSKCLFVSFLVAGFNPWLYDGKNSTHRLITLTNDKLAFLMHLRDELPMAIALTGYILDKDLNISQL